MGFFEVVKKGVAAGWNFPAWLGAKDIKKNAILIKDLSTTAFVTEKRQGAPKKETFEQAMRRLKMTEADLQKRMKASGQIILACGLLAIPMLGYTIYMLYSGFYLSSFVCLMLTGLAASYCFREHFNRFQMRQRRLGCTLQEWALYTFRLTRNK